MRLKDPKLIWPLLAVFWTAMLIYFSFQAGSPNSADPPFSHFDKVLHFFFYGMLALIWLKCLASHTKLYWLIILAVAFLGASDEIHQGYVPYRDASVLDWFADLAGALSAIFVHRTTS